MLHVLPKLYLLFFISLSKALMYVAINYQKGGEKVSRIPDVPDNVLRGKKRSLRGETILKDPRCLMFKRRDATCLLEERDMFI